MTSLQLRYDGYQKMGCQEKECPFPTRTNYYHYDRNKVNQVKTEKVKEKEFVELTAEVNLWENLSETEKELNELKEEVALLKTFFEDLFLKLASFSQIMQLVRVNEKRKSEQTGASTVDVKTELLKLVQSPVYAESLSQVIASLSGAAAKS